jgi:hypothetical protein
MDMIRSPVADDAESRANMPTGMNLCGAALFLRSGILHATFEDERKILPTLVRAYVRYDYY